MCGPQQISPDVARHIAASGAAAGQVATSPFGEDDETGMPRLVTESSVARVLERSRSGRIYDLSVDLFMGMPTWTAGGEPPFQIWMTHTPQGSVVDDPLGLGAEHNDFVAWSADSISMFTHCGTHLDTLNHFGYSGRIWNNFEARRYLGSMHWTRAGADAQPPVVGRGVLIDIARLHGVDMLPDSYGIGEDDLRQALEEQGTKLEIGDTVLIRTGRMSVWPNAELFLPREPGLNREGAEFLARAGAITIGADNIALEQLPSTDSGNWAPVHTFLLAEAGIPMIEVAYLEELARDRCFEFLYIGACLKIRGATSGPLRPLALPL